MDVAVNKQFDLFGNAASRVLLVLIAIVMTYAFADTLLIPYVYANGLFITAYVGAALLGLIAGLYIGRELPRADRLGVTLILAAAVGWAAHPAALRLNQWTSSQGEQTIAYQAVGPGRFEAQDAAMPPLQFKDHADFWARWKAGDPHDFRMLKGALGFWQVDMRPVQQEISEYNGSQL